MSVIIFLLVRVIQTKQRRIMGFSITDRLTGLFNSNHFPDRFEHETGMSRRFGSPLSVIFLDLDNLKAANDRYGHQRGNSLLGDFGRLLSLQVRHKVDLCFRFGGDEFVVLCPRAGLAEAHAMAQRIVESVRLSPLLRGSGVTVSAGLAELLPGEKTQDLLHRADQALYEAKALGKSRVECASSSARANFPTNR